MRKTILVLAVLSLILILNSCQKAEEVTVKKYFQAMQGNDRVTMAAMAHEPRDIEFKEYQILSIEDLGEKDVLLPKLTTHMAELEKQRKKQVITAMDKRDELDEAEEELDETRRRSKKIELEKKIEELTAAADVEKQKVLNLQLAINETKKLMDREKALTEKSTGMGDNLELFSGKTNLQLVTVKVTTEKGESSDYYALLRSNILRHDNKEQKGRLIIVKLMTNDEYKQYKEESKKDPIPQPKQIEEVTEPEAETEAQPAEEKPAE